MKSGAFYYEGSEEIEVTSCHCEDGDAAIHRGLKEVYGLAVRLR